MAEVKNTKNELKAQRDAQRRYERYLPTLQLKQQQLQVEVRQAERRVAELRQRVQDLVAGCAAWRALFADEVDFGAHVELRAVRVVQRNIAGVAAPSLLGVDLDVRPASPVGSPPWHDDAILLLAGFLRLQAELHVVQEQHRLLAAELRVTSQRVNLFERIKIPECRAAIRKVRIALGDAMTLDVARGKIAKRRAQEQETSR